MLRKCKCQKIFWALLALLISTLLIGCGGSRPDPEEVITKAQVAIKEVQTYRSEMVYISTENGQTTRSSAQMEFVSPDRMHVIPVNGNGTGESIRIGNTEYRWESDSQNWQVHQWPESSNFTNPAVRWVEGLDSLVGLVEMADEKIDGVDCLHYKGIIDMKARSEEERAKLDPSQPGYEERMRALELYDRCQFQCEFWVGKEDFLLRQLKQHQEVVFIKYAGEDTEREERHSTTATYRFFDFNKPIQIEPPPAELIEGIRLIASMGSTGGGDDLKHYQVNYKITISNKGIETARDIRVFVDSLATSQGLRTMEAEPDHRPVNLGPDESETFLVSWEYDFTRSSKEEFLKLIRQNVLRATWIDENGQQHEKVLRKGG